MSDITFTVIPNIICIRQATILRFRSSFIERLLLFCLGKTDLFYLKTAYNLVSRLFWLYFTSVVSDLKSAIVASCSVCIPSAIGLSEVCPLFFNWDFAETLRLRINRNFLTALTLDQWILHGIAHLRLCIIPPSVLGVFYLGVCMSNNIHPYSPHAVVWGSSMISAPRLRW